MISGDSSRPPPLSVCIYQTSSDPVSVFPRYGWLMSIGRRLSALIFIVEPHAETVVELLIERISHTIHDILYHFVGVGF